MSNAKVMKIRLALKGRPIRSYRFTKDEITVGRSPESDVFLDNPGVSRIHLKFVRSSEGSYLAEDQGSANGTFVNDEQVQRELLMHNDVVRVGKFTLWVAYDSDQREQGSDFHPQVSPQTYQGTTVLSGPELEGMLARAREEESTPHPAGERPRPELVELPMSEQAKAPDGTAVSLAWAVLGAIVIGASVGAAVMWWLLR